MQSNKFRKAVEHTNHTSHKYKDHFAVVCLVAWPFNESEARDDLVLIETSMPFSH